MQGIAKSDSEADSAPAIGPYIAQQRRLSQMDLRWPARSDLGLHRAPPLVHRAAPADRLSADFAVARAGEHVRLQATRLLPQGWEASLHDEAG